jgi:hypothetical protein
MIVVGTDVIMHNKTFWYWSEGRPWWGRQRKSTHNDVKIHKVLLPKVRRACHRFNNWNK